MNMDTDTLEKQYQLHQQRLKAQARPDPHLPPTGDQDQDFDDCNRKVAEIKRLLIKFKVSFRAKEGSNEYHEFARFLTLNDQLQTPKNICLNCWSFVNMTQTMDHINILKHTIIYQDKFSDMDRFIQLARDSEKVIVNDDLTLTIVTPPTTPLSIDQINHDKSKQMTTVGDYLNQKNSTLKGNEHRMDEQLKQFRQTLGIGANNFMENGNVEENSNLGSLLVEEKDAHKLPPNMPNFDPTLDLNKKKQYIGPPCPPGHPYDPFGEDREYFKERVEGAALFAPPEERDPNFFENFGRDEKFVKEAKALLDLGETNGNLEMIRLNKKFDIFLKRFMKVEEDIKEIKNNFFRVMHCAFAKYEEGFKRKNEYLERRRVRKREEIERGVQRELEKRKIEVLADEAARNATPEVSSESSEDEIDDRPPTTDEVIDEKRFLKSMERQDKREQEEYDKQQEEERIKKKKKAQEIRIRQLMEKYPQGLPSHFFREQKPKKDKKKKKKKYKNLDMEPASVKKQLLMAGPSNVSTRGRRGEDELTSFNSNDQQQQSMVSLTTENEHE